LIKNNNHVKKERSSHITSNNITSNNHHHKLCKACREKNNHQKPPTIPIDEWPQYPLLLRPTPGSGTIVKSVRMVNNTLQKDKYLMNLSDDDDDDTNNNVDSDEVVVADDDVDDGVRVHTHNINHDTTTTTTKNNNIAPLWWNQLKVLWNGHDVIDDDNDNDDSIKSNNDPKSNKNSYTTNVNGNYSCPTCCCLPINNGNEEQGQTLVIDFESNIFEGTLQLRIRNSNGTTNQPYNDNYGFFNGRNRQYQCIISGRFKKEIPMIECYHGHIFRKPLRTPSPYIVKGGLKIANFFAPRLQAKLSGSTTPFMLSPLGSAPQTIQVDTLQKNVDADVDADVDIGESFKASEEFFKSPEEPSDDSRRLISLRRRKSESASASSSVSCAKARKKMFDKICGEQNKSFIFRTDKVYTFEFLQHLLEFDKFELNLGNMMGRYHMANMVNGQPLQIMATHQSPLTNNGGNGNYNNLCQGSTDNTIIGDSVYNSIWSFDLWHASILQPPVKK